MNSISLCFNFQVLQLEHCSPTYAGHAGLSEATAKGKKLKSSQEFSVNL